MKFLYNIFNKIENRRLHKYVIPYLSSKYANLLQCSKNDLWNQYFVDAESGIQFQWDKYIWPLINKFDFNSVLELAPGGGRNTERLCSVAKNIYAIDYNFYAIEQCRKRLGNSHSGCNIEYHVNNGLDINMIQNESITAIYCWDAAVHFDKSIFGSYLPEFSRVLKKGGQGFIHHSNLGDMADKNIKKNPGWRSNMDKKKFVQICDLNGLQIVEQVDVNWGKDKRGREITDCCSVFKK